MLTDKQAAIKMVKQLPDDASFEDIFYTLRYTEYIRRHIAEGLKQADEGDLIPHEEIVREMAEWAQSVGQALPDETFAASATTSAATPRPTRRRSSRES